MLGRGADLLDLVREGAIDYTVATEQPGFKHPSRVIRRG